MSDHDEPENPRDAPASIAHHDRPTNSVETDMSLQLVVDADADAPRTLPADCASTVEKPPTHSVSRNDELDSLSTAIDDNSGSSSANAISSARSKEKQKKKQSRPSTSSKATPKANLATNSKSAQSAKKPSAADQLKNDLLQQPHLLQAGIRFFERVNKVLRQAECGVREEQRTLDHKFLDMICKLLQADEVAIALTVLPDEVVFASNYPQKQSVLQHRFELERLDDEDGSPQFMLRLHAYNETGIDSSQVNKLCERRWEGKVRYCLHPDGTYRPAAGSVITYDAPILMENEAIMEDPQRYAPASALQGRSRVVNVRLDECNNLVFTADEIADWAVGDARSPNLLTHHIDSFSLRITRLLNVILCAAQQEDNPIRWIETVSSTVADLLQTGFNYRFAEWKFKSVDRRRPLLPFYGSPEHKQLIQTYKDVASESLAIALSNDDDPENIQKAAEALRVAFEKTISSMVIPDTVIPNDKFRKHLFKETCLIIELCQTTADLARANSVVLFRLLQGSRSLLNSGVKVHAEMMILGYVVHRVMTPNDPCAQLHLTTATLPIAYCAVSKPCCALCTYCMEEWSLLLYPGMENPKLFGFGSWSLPDQLAQLPDSRNMVADKFLGQECLQSLAKHCLQSKYDPRDFTEVFIPSLTAISNEPATLLKTLYDLRFPSSLYDVPLD